MTGWGSAVNSADVSPPGDTVVIIGCGGIGSGAIQGARLAGAEHIVVVDLVEAKRDKAFEFGATHFVTSMPEAMELVGELTRGVMADSALLTMGVLEGRMIDEALNIIRKGGAVVMTAIASMADVTPTLSMAMMTLFQKRLLGSLYGEANPRADIPRLLNLYRDGKLLLDETVTAEYKLNDINEGYDDMLAGRNIRGRDHPRPLARATRSEALDDRDVGGAAALAHRLQTVATAGALQGVQHRGEQLAPVAPRGWPSAIAPPFGLTFAGVGTGLLQPRHHHGANASLISTVSMSSIDRPVFFSAYSVAGIGPVSMNTGSAPRALMWWIRARGLRPCSLTACSDASRTALAPSEIWLAIAAVSRPPSESVFNPAIFSSDVSRGPSSVTKVPPSTSTGMISFSK